MVPSIEHFNRSVKIHGRPYYSVYYAEGTTADPAKDV